MIEFLQQQYQLTQQTRAIVFAFLTNELKDDLNTPVPDFADKTIGNLLHHSGNCYYNWLACFALQKTRLAAPDQITMDHLRQLYALVDETVATFLLTFREKMDTPINGVHNFLGPLSATPLQLFTHTLTHEFHHKGQIMSMCRVMGHQPPDTDVSNSFISQ